jgi:hypothetical protein
MCRDPSSSARVSAVLLSLCFVCFGLRGSRIPIDDLVTYFLAEEGLVGLFILWSELSGTELCLGVVAGSLGAGQVDCPRRLVRFLGLGRHWGRLLDDEMGEMIPWHEYTRYPGIQRGKGNTWRLLARLEITQHEHTGYATLLSYVICRFLVHIVILQYWQYNSNPEHSTINVGPELSIP